MYRFLLTRRWIVAGLVVLAAVVAMVALGLWQLRRHDEVRAANDRVRAGLAVPAVPISEVLPSGDDGTDAVYRRVRVEGTYDTGSEVVIDNRSLEGRPGRHLITPLVAADGNAVLVDRGWIPLDADPATARPPSTPVLVVGVLFPTERKGSFGPAIQPSGRLTSMPRIDVPRIAKQLPHPVAPLYARLETQTPSQGGELPRPPGLPDLSGGPHLSYAVQWFLFGSVAVAVFSALVYREAARRRRMLALG